MITNIRVLREAHYCVPERYVFEIVVNCERAKAEVYADIPVYEDYSTEEVLAFANLLETYTGCPLSELIAATAQWHKNSKCYSYSKESETVSELVSLVSQIPAVAQEIILTRVVQTTYIDDHGTTCDVIVTQQ